MNVKKSAAAFVAAGTLLIATHASAVTLTFENLAEGATLSNQYAAQGVTFSPNAFSGAGGPTGDWATNTDMTITSTDIGGLGTPSLVSGNVLHGFAGWFGENGDPSFRASFSSAISSFSAAFAGVATPGDVKLYAYNGATLLGTAVSTVTTGQFILSFSAPTITSIVVTPGSFDDWVAVDNINFTVSSVPEPATYLLMALGLGLMATTRRLSARR